MLEGGMYSSRNWEHDKRDEKSSVLCLILRCFFVIIINQKRGRMSLIRNASIAVK